MTKTNSSRKFASYIDNTYDQHYSLNKYQSTEFIIDSGHGEGFCIANIMKYGTTIRKERHKNRSRLVKSFTLCLVYVICSRQRGTYEKISEETRSILKRTSQRLTSIKAYNQLQKQSRI